MASKKIVKLAAHKVFKLINSKYRVLQIANSENEPVLNPNDATVFNFMFSVNKEEIGTVLVNVTENKFLNIFFDKNMTLINKTRIKQEWYALLRAFRKIAMQLGLVFNCKDITSSPTQMISECIGADTKMHIYYSNDKVKNVVFETVKNNKIVVENSPTTYLPACRVIAKNYDLEKTVKNSFTKHILQMVRENNKLHMVAKSKTLKESDLRLVNKRIKAIEQCIKNLRFSEIFLEYKEKFENIKTLQDDFVFESMKKTIAKTSPLLETYSKNSPIGKMILEFERNIRDINPRFSKKSDHSDILSDKQIKEFQDIMAEPLMAGIDGVDGISVANRFFNNAELSKLIFTAAKSSPDIDVRPIFKTWITTHLPALSDIIDDNIAYSEKTNKDDFSMNSHKGDFDSTSKKDEPDVGDKDEEKNENEISDLDSDTEIDDKKTNKTNENEDEISDLDSNDKLDNKDDLSSEKNKNKNKDEDEDEGDISDLKTLAGIKK